MINLLVHKLHAESVNNTNRAMTICEDTKAMQWLPVSKTKVRVKSTVDKNANYLQNLMKEFLKRQVFAKLGTTSLALRVDMLRTERKENSSRRECE